MTKNRSAEENLTIILQQRIKDLEEDMIDAKNFSHLSSNALEILQKQIDELRVTLENLIFIIHKETINQKSFTNDSDKIGIDYC